MTLKTYRGKSMAEALAEVKKDLGKDAVILHTRTYKVGGVLGIGSQTMVEITASDGTVPSRAPGHRTRTTRRVKGAPRSVPAVVPSDGEPNVDAARLYGEPARSRLDETPLADPRQPVMAGAVRTPGVVPRHRPSEADHLDHDRQTPRAVETHRPVARRGGGADDGASFETTSFDPAAFDPASFDGGRGEGFRPGLENLEPKATVLRAPPPEAKDLATRVRVAPVDDVARESLEDEIASIKRMVGHVLQNTRPKSSGAVGAMPDALFEEHLKLIDHDVEDGLADLLTGVVRDELTATELADRSVVRQTLLRVLADRLRVAGTGIAAGMQADGRPRTVALIGPTGVGKTTTVAKLAATLKLRHGHRVGLITCDTYRIAAVEQLRTYANIIGVPVKVAMGPEEVHAAAASLTDVDVVLVDTAGRSQRDRERLDELGIALRRLHPHETHMVLAANIGERVMRQAAERFSALEPSHVMLTKLDEAVTLGAIFNVLQDVGRPVSYVTTGQEVPDHIELAHADRLARLLLDGGGAM
ncbi:MAG: flagellar biosynthesis protein FlhF [Phycisphaerales bacterium]|nr:flagellar biosynthesis protein FlhF [Phycisphaerales bacterium]